MKLFVKEQIGPHRYRTPQGYLVCTDAILARTGKQVYKKGDFFPGCADSDNDFEVDRPASEVFSQEAISSFENMPLTIEHPNESVDTDNYKSYAVGYVRDVHKATYDGKDVLMGNLVVYDNTAIESIMNGSLPDLSCGYDCEVNDENNPSQTKIRGNHVALCEHGRAGIAHIQDSTSKVNDWYPPSSYVRSMCISHDWYTAGTISDYNKLLGGVDNGWTVEMIAKDIYEHSRAGTDYNNVLRCVKETLQRAKTESPNDYHRTGDSISVVDDKLSLITRQIDKLADNGYLTYDIYKTIRKHYPDLTANEMKEALSNSKHPSLRTVFRNWLTELSFKDCNDGCGKPTKDSRPDISAALAVLDENTIEYTDVDKDFCDIHFKSTFDADKAVAALRSHDFKVSKTRTKMTHNGKESISIHLYDRTDDSVKDSDKEFMTRAMKALDAIKSINKVQCLDRVSPMTYKKLKELGYTEKDWAKWDDKKKVEMSQRGKSSSSKTKSAKTNSAKTKTKSNVDLNSLKKKIDEMNYANSHFSEEYHYTLNPDNTVTVTGGYDEPAQKLTLEQFENAYNVEKQENPKYFEDPNNDDFNKRVSSYLSEALEDELDEDDTVDYITKHMSNDYDWNDDEEEYFRDKWETMIRNSYNQHFDEEPEGPDWDRDDIEDDVLAKDIIEHNISEEFTPEEIREWIKNRDDSIFDKLAHHGHTEYFDDEDEWQFYVQHHRYELFNALEKYGLDYLENNYDDDYIEDTEFKRRH